MYKIGYIDDHQISMKIIEKKIKRRFPDID